MNVKQLRKLIAETVKREMDKQKSEIIKEVKADLFDVILSSKPTSAPSPQTQPVNEHVDPTPPELDRESLRAMFESRMSEVSGGDTIMASPQSLAPTPEAQGTRTNIRVPENANIQNTPETEKVLRAINKDYSALMARLNNK